MRLAADLPEVMPDDADERIRPVYADIQRTLRVPFVNLIFRSLANFPSYLVPAWQLVSPIARTCGFETAADGLRATSLLEPASASRREWSEVEDLDRLRAFNATIHYVLPKLLLVTTAFEMSAFKDRRRTEAPPAAAAPGRSRSASPTERPVRRWSTLTKPRASWRPCSPVSSGAVPDLGRQDEVRALLAAFRLKFIPDMMLDVALITAPIDGPEAATTSKFSV